MSAFVERKRKRSEALGKNKLPRQKRSKHLEYHSSSEDETHSTNAKVNGTFSQAKENKARDRMISENVDKHLSLTSAHSSDDEESEESEESAGEEDMSADATSDSDDSSTVLKKRTKRHDPETFATSISKILSSKLTTSKRADPVLSRSKTASAAAKELTENKLEAKAKKKLKDEKRAAREKDRETDVLGVERGEAAEAAELEKTLRKTAQRGVVKLFNAVRAAQVKTEDMERESRSQGTFGIERRKEKITEMSKKGFMDLLVDGSST